MTQAQSYSEEADEEQITPEATYFKPWPNGYSKDDSRDSLWLYDGTGMAVWTDFQDVLAAASSESGGDIPAPVRVPVDFYPLSISMSGGIISGVESDLTERRDLGLSIHTLTIRVSQLCLKSLPLLTSISLDSLVPAVHHSRSALASQRGWCSATRTSVRASALLLSHLGSSTA